MRNPELGPRCVKEKDHRGRFGSWEPQARNSILQGILSRNPLGGEFEISRGADGPLHVFI